LILNYFPFNYPQLTRSKVINILLSTLNFRMKWSKKVILSFLDHTKAAINAAQVRVADGDKSSATTNSHLRGDCSAVFGVAQNQIANRFSLPPRLL